MSILDLLEEWEAYIHLGLFITTIVCFILILILFTKQSRLKKKYLSFMSGKDGKNLEESMLSRYAKLDNLSEVVKNMDKDIKNIHQNLLIAYQKVGIVKYDAFHEVGGKLSFVLAMLTKDNDGFIMNCMHSSREGCFTYIKEISKGEAFVILSEEEAQALEEAKRSQRLTKES